MLLTTAGYDDERFMQVLNGILGNDTLLDSRYDPSVPYVFGLTSIMSSKPTHVVLYRNYNYSGGESPDRFTVDPDEARAKLGLSSEFEEKVPKSSRHKEYQGIRVVGSQVRSDGSRHPGSFRVLQRIALRASAAAPTFFKPVQMADGIFVDGGLVASNPTSVAIHEAKVLFPDVPIELVVSLGTGGFNEARFKQTGGWGGIVDQILNSALDGEKIHHILEDIWGDNGIERKPWRNPTTSYYRFNPMVGGPDDVPIDSTDPEVLEELSRITDRYMQQPQQQRWLKEISELYKRDGWRKWKR
eukprot:CAMPEP_0116848390 /NCGR_PEP_ID=MMETSP0418-20121206/14971_1 /TAXON_ID=1158023 /ORGANISM="Astrosyne radiata, Strain 13vi08-1A" /LENGTH=299 /DNA_ID=CAMNT_0004479957 /DNA_START=18 /DNA_END=917 /DNA_ORIENTATION=-